MQLEEKRLYAELDGKTIINPFYIYNVKLYSLDIKISTASFIPFSLQ